MSQEIKDIIKKFQEFKTEADSLGPSAQPYKANLPPEQKVLRLRNVDKMLNSKLTMLKSVNKNVDKEKKPSTEEFLSTRQELLEKILHQKLNKMFCRYVYLNNLTQYLMKNVPVDETSANFKEKIIQQLKIMNDNHNATMQIVEQQNKNLEEIINKKIKRKECFIDHKESVECQEKIEKEKQKTMNLKYKEQVENTEGRIIKLNFMRNLTLQLLKHSNNWTEDEEYQIIFENIGNPVHLDDFIQ